MIRILPTSERPLERSSTQCDDRPKFIVLELVPRDTYPQRKSFHKFETIPRVSPKHGGLTNKLLIPPLRVDTTAPIGLFTISHSPGQSLRPCPDAVNRFSRDRLRRRGVSKKSVVIFFQQA